MSFRELWVGKKGEMHRIKGRRRLPEREGAEAGRGVISAYSREWLFLHLHLPSPRAYFELLYTFIISIYHNVRA